MLGAHFQSRVPGAGCRHRTAKSGCPRVLPARARRGPGEQARVRCRAHAGDTPFGGPEKAAGSPLVQRRLSS
eukprot:1616564-Pyramimonas_sp.AAC.1